MCAIGDESNKWTRYFLLLGPSQYISQSFCNHKSIIHKSIDKEAYMWISGFFPHGESKKTNACVLKDVTSFLSNSTGPSNSSQQWGLKSPEETLVKDEITGYNEG